MAMGHTEEGGEGGQRYKREREKGRKRESERVSRLSQWRWGTQGGGRDI